ncbi:cadherin-related family member 5 [Elgaria multicarinata webbii]|uniref:cadherin-related family member 5 n=1 Tax=Elgaria multicarinata webbii TaxID=159646 RepID=UPI002FCCD6C5
MDFFSHFCICMLFFLVSVTPLQAVGETCSVDKTVLNIQENNAAGLVVTNITAAPDTTVEIDPAKDTQFQWFEIKGSQLILKYSVDFENITVLVVELACLRGDIKVESLTVVVIIDNVNDNRPIFEETNITVHVSEDTKVNTIVVPQANVTATDADFDVISYRLTGNPTEATGYFNIQGVNNPQITLLKALDYEKLNFMVLTLYAMDGNADAPGTHTATATINIHVFQADLRPPWFQPCTPIAANSIICLSHGYTGAVNISEKVTDPLTLKPGPLYAIDGDESLNEEIVYEIASGNENNTFAINNSSGNITMNKPANSLNTFLLYVLASQANNPSKYSQTTVEIQVIHQSNHTPQFEKPTYVGRVSVGQPVSSLIMEANASSVPLQIFAADDDFPDKVNPFIKYSLENITDFRVTTDGLLLTTVILNQASRFTFLAIAKDTKDLQEASTVIVVDVTPLANLPTTPSGATNLTTSPTSTTKNSGITETAGKPVTVTTSSSGTPPFLTTVKPPIITDTSQPTVGTGKPTVGTDKPTVGAGKSTVETSKATVGTDKPTVGTSKPTVGTDKPTVGTGKPTVGTGKPTVGTGESTVGTGESTVGTSKPTVGTGESTVGTGVNAPPAYTAHDMAALGATLGCLLAITLVLLGVICYRYYRMKRDYGEGSSNIFGGFINSNFKLDEKPNSDEKQNLSPPSIVEETTLPVTLASLENSLAVATAFDAIIEGNEESEDSDSQKEVKSILTKDRKVGDDGYKAVWFKDDIDPEARDDVMVIEDDSDTERNRNDNAVDESSDDDDNDRGRGGSDMSIVPGRVQLPDAEETSICL